MLELENTGGVVTRFEYDLDTRLLIAKVLPGSPTRRIIYVRDDYGRVWKTIDPKGFETINTFNDKDQLMEVKHPDNKIETFTYYAQSGLKKTHTDRVGRVTEFEYDTAGRCTLKILARLNGDPNGQITEWIDTVYNAAGQVTSETLTLTTGSSAVTREFDTRGRMKKIVQDGAEVSFTWHKDNTPKTKSYSGKELTWVYHPDGRLNKIHDANLIGDQVTFGYHPTNGLINSMSLPNNVLRTVTYGVGNRIDGMTQNLFGANETFGYEYDSADRLDLLTGLDYAIDYQYDSASRLWTETRTGSGAYAHTFLYDKNDNREKLTSGANVWDYTYNAMNQLKEIKLNNVVETVNEFDDIGRMWQRTKNGLITNFGYDRLDRLTTVTPIGQSQLPESYSYYGPTALRKSKAVGGDLTTFIHDGSNCVSQTTNSLSTTRYFVPGGTPLWETTTVLLNSNRVVYAQNGRGDITGLWNGNAYTEQYSYDAYGEVKTTDGAGATIANTSGPRYRGYQFDAGANHYATGWRPYRPDVGSFGSLDPAGSPNGPNRYNYCGSDPVNRTDRMGTDWIWENGAGDVFYQGEEAGGHIFWLADVNVGDLIPIGTRDGAFIKLHSQFGGGIVDYASLSQAASELNRGPARNDLITGLINDVRGFQYGVASSTPKLDAAINILDNTIHATDHANANKLRQHGTALEKGAAIGGHLVFAADTVLNIATLKGIWGAPAEQAVKGAVVTAADDAARQSKNIIYLDDFRTAGPDIAKVGGMVGPKPMANPATAIGLGPRMSLPSNARTSGQLYEVGLAKDLRKTPVSFTQVNHAPQVREAELLIGSFNPANRAGNEPGIRLLISEHTAVTTAQQAHGAVSSVRDLLARDIWLLRKHTEAPNSALKELIELNKRRHYWDYKK